METPSFVDLHVEHVYLLQSVAPRIFSDDNLYKPVYQWKLDSLTLVSLLNKT